MKLTKVFILVSVLTSCSAASIYKTSKQDEVFYLFEAAAEVVKSCYGSQISTVGLSVNSDGFFIKALQSSTSISVTLLDSMKRVVSYNPLQLKSRYKIQVFVISASSTKELEKIFSTIKNSVWWNHMASVFILVRLPFSEEGCSKAFEMLFAAWRMNLINTKLICLHQSKGTLIYTYNPYTRMAPKSWMVDNTHRGENGHPWTLLVRSYQEGSEKCEDLDFDKTTDLGGYEIRSTVKIVPGQMNINLNKSGLDCLEGNTASIYKTLLSALKGTPKFFIHNRTGGLGYKDEKGRDIMMDVVEGNSDIMINRRYTIVKDGITTTYPHAWYGLSVVTQYSGEMSQLNKIRSVVDGSSRMGICVVILISLLFFILVMRQSPGPGILNILRLVCNGSLLIGPTNLASRLYLCSLFIVVVTIQALYQGKLAALLTKPVLLPNVNTLQDLVDRDYTVYGYETIEHYFKPPLFDGRFVTLKDFFCLKYVLNDASAACVSDYYWIAKETEKLKLYYPRDILVKLPASYVIRGDWPLEERVNKIFKVMTEAHIIEYEFKKSTEKILSLRRFEEKHEQDQQFKVMTFRDLSFAFVILGICLGCSTICFIVELAINQRLSRNSTVGRFFRQSRHTMR